MGTVHILLMDLDPDACPGGYCGRLAGLLQRPLGAEAIHLRTVTHVAPEAPSPPPDLVLMRPSLLDSVSEIVRDLKSRWRFTPILGLFCSGKHTPAAVHHAMCNGLDDFLSCPFKDIDLLPRMQRFVEGQETALYSAQDTDVKAQLHRAGLIGESASFLRVIEHVLKVAHSDATVLLNGETGTGKELVARSIHYCSPQRDKSFVPVHCGALPDHLVENELFGHVKGAYTDASSPEKGLVAEAEEGSLFLDEVDTLSASAQVKLLRFLQDRAYRPLGSARSLTANVRIIAATNADLWEQVRHKRFREDLYYRLHVMAFRLPPLRERADDIPRLALHLLRRYRAQYGHGPQQFSAAAMDKLIGHAWPGNIRELETVIQRAVLLAASSILHPDDIELPFSNQSAASKAHSFREAKARVIEQFERSYLTTLLSAHDGNITRAAQQAGKERRAFTRLLQKYDLQRCSFRP